ncbi:MAG: hypothetical protein HC788_04820 [Sphingopyxis sp.]|nr:hypothetical protein [Sphingopyxis sp.]
MVIAEAGAETAPKLAIELNKAEQAGTACSLSFVVANPTGVDITSLSTEIVLFGADNGVLRFAIFDFQQLPATKTRVRQFNLPDTSCGSLKRIIINDVSTCEGGVAAADVCARGFSVETRTSVELM